jgi:prolipoprotein diacylglyceryltransferase
VTGAIVELSFDPFVRVGGLVIAWRSIGLSLVIVAALAVFTRRSLRAGAAPLDDIVYIVLGTVPGAVLGGRIAHGLSFPDAYLAQPGSLLDLGRGSMSLLGAVLGGTVSAAYICRLLDRPVGRTLDTAAVSLLLAIGLGKLVELLGGGGQGSAFDGPWAVALTGAGPWRSPAAATPAHPSQVYEGLWTLAGVPLLVWAFRRDAGHAAGTGKRFAAALAWWLVGRFLVGFTWRDDRIVGPLTVDQALILLVLVVLVVAALAAVRGYRSGVSWQGSEQTRTDR